MKIEKFLDDLAIISKLGDNPSADNNLTSEGLKAKFDEAVLKLQSYINNTLVESINSIFSLDAPPHEGMNMTGPINMNNQQLTGITDPTKDSDAINKGFADKSYLPFTGGTMEGPINMNGQGLSGLNAPTAENDPATKGYVDSRTLTLNANLSTNNWSDTAPFTQTVEVAGMLSSDFPFVDINLSDVDDAMGVIEGWTMVGRVTVSGDNEITAYCYEEVPTIDIPIVFKVVR